MEDNIIPLLYSKIKKNIVKKPYKLLGVTKNLTISTEEYSSFYKSSINIFQKKTFKVPEHTQYPLLRESQKKYISLRTRLNTFSFKDKKNKPKILMPSSAKTRIVNLFSEKGLKKTKKNINFFICEKNYNGKREKNIFSFKTEKNNFIKRNHPPEFFNSINYFKYAEPVEEIKNPEERIKDFFMLLNSIFRQENHICLKYKEKEIFGHKEDYYDYIKDELIKYKNKEKEINIKYFLSNSIKTKGYGKLDLIFKSARIDIIDESMKNNNIVKCINIPFDSMGLIYLCNLRYIIQIIFFILNKVDLNDKNIILPDEIIKKLFLKIISKIKLDENKYSGIKFNLDKRNREKYTVRIFYLKSIETFTEASKYSELISAFIGRDNAIKIISNNGNEKSKNIINKKKIMFFNNFDYYKTLLIFKGKKYKIKFCMPEISLIFRDYEKQLNHCIDTELFLYLHQNNFVDWDFFIVHYLYHLQDFRYFIGKNLSLRSNINLFLRKKIINENNKIDFSESKKSNLYNINIGILSALNNNYNKYYINNFYTSKININEDEHKFIFTIFDGKNFIKYKFKSYILYAFINNVNKPDIYSFKFNFRQMKVLYYRSKFENFKLFLKRLISIKNKIIHLDYSYFDSFNSMKNDEIYEFFYKLEQNNKEEPHKEEVKLNSLVIKIREPHFEIISNDKEETDYFKVLHYRIELDKKFISKLINNDVNDWMKIILDNKDIFKENNFKKYDEYKFRQSRKRSVIFK